MSFVDAALFLDRDGTLIADRGYIRDAGEVRFYPYTFEALRRAQSFYSLFIITNQPGIAEGFLTHEEVSSVNKFIIDSLFRNGVRIEDCFVCPHAAADACRCRKPNTFFVDLAAREHRLDATRCCVIGDHPSDVVMAKRCGMHGIYVLTGHGMRHRHELPAGISIKRNLYYAVNSILACRNKTQRQITHVVPTSLR